MYTIEGGFKYEKSEKKMDFSFRRRCGILFSTTQRSVNNNETMKRKVAL